MQRRLRLQVSVTSVRQLSEARAALTVASSGVAAFVTLDTDAVEGTFSENGLLLLPWEPRTIIFTGMAFVKFQSLSLHIHPCLHQD